MDFRHRISIRISSVVLSAALLLAVGAAPARAQDQAAQIGSAAETSPAARGTADQLEEITVNARFKKEGRPGHADLHHRAVRRSDRGARLHQRHGHRQHGTERHDRAQPGAVRQVCAGLHPRASARTISTTPSRPASGSISTTSISTRCRARNSTCWICPASRSIAARRARCAARIPRAARSGSTPCGPKAMIPDMSKRGYGSYNRPAVPGRLRRFRRPRQIVPARVRRVEYR